MPVRPAPAAPVIPPPVQPLQGALRPQPSQEMQPLPAPTRPTEPARSGLSTFTDKIRAVIYPGGRNVTAVPEPTWQPTWQVSNSGVQPQPTIPAQQPDIQPRMQASPRYMEAEYSPNIYREDMVQQASPNALQAFEPTFSRISDAATERRNSYSAEQTYSTAHHASIRSVKEESSLDQLSRMLNDSQPVPRNALVNGNMQNNTTYAAPGLDIDQQELQAIRAQILRAAQLDEAYERSAMPQPRPVDLNGLGAQLRASPIQDMPFERGIEYRRVSSETVSQASESHTRPALAVPQPMQAMPPVQQQVYRTAPIQASPAQVYQPPLRSVSPARDAPPEVPFSMASHLPSRPTTVHPEVVDEAAEQTQKQATNPLMLDGASSLSEQIQATLQQNLARRPEVTTSDDMLLDIVKSLPPMAPAPPIPPPPPVLNGRATRSLGSVLLEGHLVPEERLQVAQHVQRMMRGVDLNYQLGEILLMFKLLTPDQLLAASLVSYGMISTIQISALGRIRQDLHAIGLEYDLESLVILFRILTPEQMREVRASWSS
jgi:hypothetical protein